MLNNSIANFPELVAQWHPTKNLDLHPEEVPAGSHKKIWWKCSEGVWPDGSSADDHEWEATANNRTASKSGCPCCKRKKTVLSNCLAATHPYLLIEYDWSKNCEWTPHNVTAGSNRKLPWKCVKGFLPDGTLADDHEWEAPPCSRVLQGCPCCDGKKIVISNCLATTHPHLLTEYDWSKNHKWTPHNVTAGSNRKLPWKCVKIDDHKWEAPPHDRTHGHGCPCCDGKKIVISNCLATTHPHLLTGYDWSKNCEWTPHNVTYSSNKKMPWKCHEGTWPNGLMAEDHEWETTASNRSQQGRGCPCCDGKKVVPSNCLMATHPHLMAEYDWSKNCEWTPHNVTTKSHKVLPWRCLVTDTHRWTAAPADRTSNNTGCPRCNESKGEKAIGNYLSKFGIPYQPQWNQGNGFSKRIRFDFAVELQNGFWLIEYHGQQHYQPVSFGSKKDQIKYKMFIKNIGRDGVKLRWCRKHLPGKLLVIPYWDFDRIESILDDFFAGKAPVISEPPEIVRKYERIRQKILDRPC